MYNVKVYDYGTEKQYRFYDKPINSGKPKEDIETIDKPKDKDNEDNEDKKVKKIKPDKPKDKDRSIVTSMNRSINKIYELTRANEWSHFVTLTFNSKVDRYDFQSCTDALKTFLDWIRRDNPDMKYVVVPELHGDGAFHFHGLFSDIPNVEMVNSGRYSYGKYVFKAENIPSNLIGKCRLIYNMGKYNYGYSDIQIVEDTKKAANYITKYITKELAVVTKGKKRYWSSRNLNKPKVTESLLTNEEKASLIAEIFPDIQHQSVVDINAEGFTNQINYVEVKKDESKEDEDNNSN